MTPLAAPARTTRSPTTSLSMTFTILCPCRCGATLAVTFAAEPSAGPTIWSAESLPSACPITETRFTHAEILQLLRDVNTALAGAEPVPL